MLATVRPQDVAGTQCPRDASDFTSSALPPRRIPKLAVRNRTPETTLQSDTAASASGKETRNEIRIASHRSQQTSSAGIEPTSSVFAWKTTQSHQRHGKAQEQLSGHRHQSKRKSAGVLGFFTLKEPSTSALEAYAEHEKRKAAQKGSNPVAIVMPGVSSQKLPEHVPKVNSKWDGLPEAAHRKSADRKERDDRSKRSSLISLSTTSSDSTRRPYESLSSKPSVRQSQYKKRSVFQVADSTEAERPHSQQSRNSRPATESPLFPSTGHAAFRARQRTYSNEDSTPPLLSLESDLSEAPALQARGYSSATSTSSDASPRTPAADMGSCPVSDSEGGFFRSASVAMSASPPATTRGQDKSVGRVAPAISPAPSKQNASKSKNHNALPWDMFQPPSESASLALSSPHEATKRNKRFGYKLGRK
ncbi:Hypothetical predicted protein [Lecanosticta acicola]|uniref:Uncharacterized protein n=1 Tax=Lecanosticta acicola TaxID=111012 RepID=A0AAI8Z6J4_9PEZI|nr:Hypothetical predicted protein [Lecanosticta acicola]